MVKKNSFNHQRMGRSRETPASVETGYRTPAPASSRRSFLKFASLGVGAALLQACGTKYGDDGAKVSGKVQLVYQDWRTDWFPEMAQKSLEKFHALNPDIQVFYTPDPENVQEKMMSDFQAGTAPDVLAGCCDFFPVWAQSGYLLDLRPYVEAEIDRSTRFDWDPAQYKALFTQDGLQYALPKYHGALALFFNKDLFDEYGIDYPDGTWDHEDYFQAMKMLTHDRDGDGEIDLWGSMLDISWERLQVHVNAWDGHFVDPENSKRSWMARPESLAALGWIRDRIWEDHVMASKLDVQGLRTWDAFIDRRVAMVEEGSWALKEILERADFRIGVAPLPRGPKRRVTLATTDGYGIFADTRYPEASWELLKFLTGKEYGRALAQAHFLQPARSSLLEDWAQAIRMQFPEETKGIDLEVFAGGHLGGYSVTAEIFWNMAEARQIAQRLWQRIFVLGQDPIERIVNASAEIEVAQSS
ncbi:MAG: sugar ABC transporter substrate-binding protein [Anaerolineales bacterium]|jgi:multiple sugar transport system substrate-binding protein